MDDLVVLGERELRAAGRRLTPQRMLVLRILAREGGHLDARELYARAQREATCLSLATVYRTLAALKELGLVRELHLDEDHHHYELDGKDGHSHFVCQGCGRVIELDSTAFASAASAAAEEHSFQVTATVIELTGYCPHCSQRRPARSTTGPEPCASFAETTEQASGS